MVVKKTGLGKGLGALLSAYDDYDDTVKKSADMAGASEIEIDKLVANPNQPRKNFDEVALAELAASIKIHGVIQPLVVNDQKDGTFLIIAGERRYRASKLAGLTKIPCVIKNYSEKQIKEISIIENLQREDLNPIESARAIKQLMEEYKMTQEAVSERIGVSRPNIANTIRLLSLCPEVIALVENNKLSAGHARCLVPVQNYDMQIKLAMAASDNKMTVRDLEKAVKNLLKPKKEVERIAPQQSIELKELVNEMQRTFATKVSVIGNDHKGRIYIDYYSTDDLDRIAEMMNLLKTKKLTLKELSEFNKRK
ncbi:MAG: ParB/RepB/Spo0J family partition protein [Clostridiales bacterium]|nr:ParB/RepB/Spo0J family partition protein [Clostridiales bacterium]